MKTSELHKIVNKPKRPQEAIAALAATYIGLREDRGSNQSSDPRLAELWTYTWMSDGYKKRQPWCSAFASACVQIADLLRDDLDFPIPPRFAGVREWIPWAEKPATGCMVFPIRKLENSFPVLLLPGDIWVMLPKLSHIAIVEKQSRIDAVQTIEGNTNTAGSRDGGGCYRMTRSRTGMGGTIIRLPARGIRR
jgi:hypothetical protein